MAELVSRIEHDDAVRHYALQLLCNGYIVKARIEGWFEAPDYIYEYQPDIFAKKGDVVLILEVKKSEGDWPKITALQRFGREHHFSVRVVSPGQALRA